LTNPIKEENFKMNLNDKIGSENLTEKTEEIRRRVV
jgi:hypothetical protein